MSGGHDGALYKSEMGTICTPLSLSLSPSPVVTLDY